MTDAEITDYEQKLKKAKELQYEIRTIGNAWHSVNDSNCMAIVSHKTGPRFGVVSSGWDKVIDHTCSIDLPLSVILGASIAVKELVLAHLSDKLAKLNKELKDL